MVEKIEDKAVSLEEFYRERAKRRVEVVDGEFVEMILTRRKPGIIIRRLFVSLYAYATNNDLGEVFQELAYVLDASDRGDWVKGSREPDVSFISKQRVAEHNEQFGMIEGP